MEGLATQLAHIPRPGAHTHLTLPLTYRVSLHPTVCIHAHLILPPISQALHLPPPCWQPIPFFNNKIVCDLMEAKRPIPGVLPILDDACRTCHSQGGSAVDAHFLDTLTRAHAAHKHLSRSGDAAFTIVHYAGEVRYTTGGFGDANNDALRPELFASTLGVATDKLVRTLCPPNAELPATEAGSGGKGGRPHRPALPPTAGSRIRTQCGSLVEALAECAPHYIRCIKSNDEKKPRTFDRERVHHQAKYLGLEENIKV